MPNLVPTYFFTFPVCLLQYLLHQPYPNKSCNKKIRTYVCSTTNPTVLLRKLQTITLQTIAGNASAAFAVGFLTASGSLSNHYFKAPLSFDGEAEPAPPLKASVIASTIVVMVKERAVSNYIIVIPCS